MLGPGIYKNLQVEEEDRQLIKSNRVIPTKYYSGIKNPKETKKQIKSIRKSMESYKEGIYIDRPKLKSHKSKTSSNIMKFNEVYGIPITNKRAVEKKTGMSVKAQERILKKGKGAYYSSGSRPGQSSSSWAYGRLASVIMGGKAKKYDQHILDEESITIKSPSKRYVKGKKITKKRKRKLQGVKSAKSIERK